MAADAGRRYAPVEGGGRDVHDPFGNLLQQDVTSGSAPAMNLTVDPNTNRITSPGFAYDAAGNLIQSPSGTFSYDSENRMVKANSQQYFYGTSGELLLKPSGPYDGTFYLYGPDGTRLAALVYTRGPLGYGYVSSGKTELRFAGRLVWQRQKFVATDRLGSVVNSGSGGSPYSQSDAWYPYGGHELSYTGLVDGDTGFGTYHSDGSSGLDYAMHRYYDPNRGRFTTPDPGESSGKIGDPSSWNRYSYVNGDPINANDPSGLNAWSWIKKLFGGSDPIDPSQQYYEDAGGGGNGPVTGGTPYDLGADTPTFKAEGTSTAPLVGYSDSWMWNDLTGWFSDTTGWIASYANNRSCRSAINTTLVGVAGIVGEGALLWFAGPELLASAGELIAEDGALGFMDAGHSLTGVGIVLATPWLVAATGFDGMADNCQWGESTSAALNQVGSPRAPRVHPPEVRFDPRIPPIFRGGR